MSNSYVPTGLGAEKNVQDLIFRQQAEQTLSPALQRVVAQAVRAPAAKVTTIKVTGRAATTLNAWMRRRFGDSLSTIRGLSIGAKETIVPKIWYERFKQAAARARRMSIKRTSVQGQPAADFMRWFRKCDLDGWAAWTPEITSGATANSLPANAYHYWSVRRQIRSVATASVFGVVSRTVSAISPGILNQIGLAAPGLQVQQHRPAMSLIDNTPTPPQAPNAPAWTLGPSTQMNGLGALGQVSGAVTSRLGAQVAQAAQVAKSQADMLKAMIKRHQDERKRLENANAVQKAAAAQRRIKEREALRVSQLTAQRAAQLQRVAAISSASSGIRKQVASLAQAVSTARAQTNDVPCATGSIRDYIFGFATMTTPPPGIAPTIPMVPATTASEAAWKLAEERRKAAQKLAEHGRRMAELRRKAAAVTAATKAEDVAPTIKPPVLDIKDGIKTDPEKAINQSAEAAENSKTSLDEKQNQALEIELLLEKFKDMLESGKAELSSQQDLTPELKDLQEKIDQLTGALADAKIEASSSAAQAAEANQAQITLMQEEINRLNALLTTSPEVAAEVAATIESYQDDINIAAQDVVDAEADLLDAQDDLISTADEAEATSDEILETKPFHVRHRNVLWLGGAVAVGIGYWWWKKNKAEVPKQNGFRRNEGYYNLPEPKTSRRPSGL